MKFFSKNYCGNVSVKIIQGFARAYSIGIDSKNFIYVPDMQAHNIVVFDQSLRLKGAFDIQDKHLHNISMPGRRISRKYPSDQILAPHAVSFDIHDCMYLTEFGGNRVTKIDASGAVVNQIGTKELVKPVVSYAEYDDCLYVSNFGMNQIIRYNLDGNLLGWLGAAKNNFTYTGWKLEGIPSGGQEFGAFDRPHAIRLGSDNCFYIADTWNHRIVKYTYDGRFIGWCGAFESGGLTDGWSFDGISKRSDELGGFNAPIEIEFDADGLIYVTDCFNNRVVKMNMDGKCLGWLGGAIGVKSEAVWRFDGKPSPGKGFLEFSLPYGLRIKNGIIYVADTNNQRLVIIKAPILGIK